MANARRTRLVEFTTGRIIRRERSATAKGLTVVAREMQQSIRDKIATPYPPASRPGRPPHKRTGFLQRNFIVERKGRKLFVRVPQYGIWLDGGTSRMAPRPFIRVNIHDRRKFWERRINAEIRKAAK